MGELMAVQVALVRRAVWGDDLPGIDQMNPYGAAAAKSAELERIEAWQASRRWGAMFGSKRG